jgi:hypothetical protein
MSSLLVIKRILCPLFEFKNKAAVLVAAAIVMVVVLATNITITNAQQQEQPSTNQLTTSSVTQNGTLAAARLFESAKDSFRVQLPEGWVIQDVNNTGFTLAAEVLRGYGLLAQLCAEGEEAEQQQVGLTNISSINGSCQQAGQEEVMHIIRYPNLDNRLGITVDNIDNSIPLTVIRYQIHKLQEVGYKDIDVVNSTRARININYTTAEGVPVTEATVPARIIDMTYSISSAPNEIRRGYLILTATNVTPPGPETITGYSIFYEGTGANATQQMTTTPSGNLSLPQSFSQVSDSFELIASEEAGQIILALSTQQAMDNEPADPVEEEDGGDEDGGDEDGGDEDGGE